MKDVVKELLAGCLAGMGNITVCHPMDTIRTRLQNTTVAEFKGPLHCAKDLFRKEGVLGFYRGFSAPFFAQAVYKSIIFSTNSIAQKIIMPNPNNGLEKVVKIFTCGAIGGCVNSFVVSPVELLRNKLIVQKSSSKAFTADGFKGPIDIIQSFFDKAEGNPLKAIRRLYTGLHLTALRDGGGMGCYFLGFELMSRLTKSDNKQLSLGGLIFSGACAGICFWSFALPFDFIKTRVQLASYDNTSTAKINFWSVIKSTKLSELYRGWQVAIGRGIPGAATTLTVYHLVKQKLESA